MSALKKTKKFAASLCCGDFLSKIIKLVSNKHFIL